MINLRNFKTIKERREVLSRELGVSLENIAYFSLKEKIASSKNCENMIGCTQIPLGIAGPLKILNSNYFIPLATTEGALVASVNRGCKAVTLSGGATVFMEKIGITRGPVFKTKSLADSFKLKTWLDEHFNDISHCSKETSNHLELKKIESQALGRNVYVRFYFDTDQAMGMNMATIAVDSLTRFIEQETKAKCVAVSANFCVDKKASWLNFLQGRGRKVWAEAMIPRKIVKKVLKTTPEKIYEVWLNKCLLGSAMSGSMSFNSHFANIIAAIFCATGQDLAQIVEGSLGITTAEVVKQKTDDLCISVYLPDLPVGVVGGGTGLTTQKEALSIIFGQRQPKSDEFAEVIAAAVLAGELSLLASLAEGSLAKAHEKLARGKS